MNLLTLIILVLVLGVIFVVIRMVGGGKSKLNMQRIEKIRQRRVGVAKSVDVSLRRKTEEAKGIAHWLMKPLPDMTELDDRLERAGKKMTSKQFVFRRIVFTLVIIFVFTVILKKSILIAIPIGLAVGVWVPFKLLARAIDKQNKAFLRLFPDALDLIVRGLRSGLPVSESLVLVSQEVPEPVGPMFGTISNTMKLGVTMEKALQETAKRLNLTEFNFFITSIILQRETGGNLSEILNNLSEVLRGRYIMRMKIVAMSSEARASAKIIGSLPFVVIAAVMGVAPDYMTPLWNDYRGNICAAIAAGMMTFGSIVMSRMTKFEI